jgi:hypothetical protein
MLNEIDRGYYDHLGRSVVGDMPVANQGDEGKYFVKYEVYFGFSLSYDVSMSTSSGNSTLTLNGANWSDYGISPGDTLNLVGLENFDASATIDGTPIVVMIDGNELIIDATIPYDANFIIGEIFVDKAPQAIKSNINLIPKDNDSGLASLIDGTNISVYNNDISLLAVSSPYSLDIFGNVSGGGLTSATITRNGDTRAGVARTYTIEYTFYWWLFLTNFEDYSFDIDCTTPYVETSFLSLWNNPATALTSGFKPLGDGNSGYRNENFNQNTNNFEVLSTIWDDGTNTTGGFDYSKTCRFTILIKNNNLSGFGNNCGLIFFNDIKDSDLYSASSSNDNGMYSHLQHTIFTENANILTNGTVTADFSSTTGVNGEELVFSSVTATLLGQELTIAGFITPNAQFISTFENEDNLNKKFALLARAESASFGASNYSDTVNLLAWRGEAKIYPAILGNYFGTARLRDHDNNIIHTY